MQPTEPVGPRAARTAPDLAFAQTMKGFGTLTDRVTPWLLDLGSWIFGALIAVNLLILASLLTVGPVDRAVLVATTALALALPPDIAGFVLLRLLEDMKNVQLEQVALRSFQEAGLTMPEEVRDEAAEPAHRRRTRRVLVYSYAILLVSFVLTVTGIAAALWHMAWWIGLAFVLMTALGQVVVAVVIFRSPSPPAAAAAAPQG